MLDTFTNLLLTSQTTYFKLCVSHMFIQLLLVQYIYVKVFNFYVTEETSNYL